MFDRLKRLTGRGTSPRHHATRRDAGSALLVVMSAAAILFVTAAAVVGIVVFQQAQQARAQAVVRATGLAQQGMEVYLTALRIDPNYRSRVPFIAGIGEDGTWTVAADNTLNTITAVGRDSATGIYHVIRATVTSQDFSGYTIVSDSAITLGNATGGVKITGTVRSNHSVYLKQSFPGLAVQYASGNVQSEGSYDGSTRVSPVDFSKAGATFPNMYTAAAHREKWATVSVPGDTDGSIQDQLTGNLAFYRDPTNPQTNYWAANSDSKSRAGFGDQPDLVGVGIDFSEAHGANAASGLFYVRSVWPPTVVGGAKVGPTAPSRDQFKLFARMDPVWNINTFWGQEIGSPARSYEKTPRGLNPNGNNVIYVGGDYDVYVKGEYSRSVTIVSEHDIYIIGDLKRSTSPSASPTATLGLVAKGNIYICGNMPTGSSVATYSAGGGATNSYTGLTYQRGNQGADGVSWGEVIPDNSDMTIQAAMLSINGAIVMDPIDASTGSNLPPIRTGTLHITGSLAAAQGLEGPNFANEPNALHGGFRNVEINYDDKLQDTPPPLFPQLGSGTLKVTRWDEYTTMSDPNSGLAFPEPVDYRPQAAVPASSVEQTYTPTGDDLNAPVTLSNAESRYIGDARITLTAIDSGAGVSQTWYSVDGGPTMVGNTINIPSPAANTAETHTVEFSSVDMDGNHEATKTVTFRMVGPDTLEPFTTVRDSANPTMTLTDGYPQPGDPDYTVYGIFYPVFTAIDTTEGSGANQIIVTQKNDPQHVSNYYEADPPAQSIDANPDLSKPLVYNLPGVMYPPTGFMTREFDYYSIDAAGNRDKTRTLTIRQHAPDLTAPITFFDVKPIYIGRATIHLTGVDDVEGQGLKDTYYKVDGGAWQRSTSNPTTITVEAPYVGQDQATHTLSFYSRDISPALNTEQTQTVTFVVAPPLPDDTTPPKTTSDAVASYVGSATINLTPTDAGGISQTYWILDGGAQHTGTKIEVPAPWTGSDSHTLQFWSVDLSGNTEAANVATFAVTPERTAPVSSAHNMDLYAGPAVFQITAQDNDGGSGLAETWYKIDNGPFQLGAGMPGLTWVTVTGDGLHTVTYYSVDHSGNQEIPKVCTFRIDTEAPTTTAHTAGPYVGQATISLEATDTGSGVKVTNWRNSADGLVHANTPVLLGAGTWDVMYWSVDNAGNEESPKTMHVVVTDAPDTTAPQSSDDITPYYKWPSPAEIHLFSWDVQTGVANMFYKLDGGDTVSMTGKSNPPAYYQVLVSSDGTHTIEYWATDKAGNTEATHKTATFVVDTAFPVTQCSARNGATYWATQTFVLTASDVGSGVKATYYSLDGGVPVRGNTIYVPAPTDGYSRPHVIQYWTIDVAGNTEAMKTVSFTSKPADTKAPITYSNAQQTYDGASTIVLTAYDELGGSGVAHTYYRLDAGAVINEGTTVPISGAGRHTLEFWSVDNAGNIETPHKTASFTIDGVAPTTTSDAKALYNAPATIHLTAADNAGGSDVLATYYKVDGGAATTGTAPLTTITVNPEGPHTLEFWSVDNAGNVETHHVVSFKIDMTAPKTLSNAVASYAGTATIALNASDETSGSGVAYTYYKVDGGLRQTGTAIIVNPPASGVTTHTITYWSVDNAGNVEAEKSATFAETAVANIVFSGATPSENSTIAVRNPAIYVTGQADQNITTVTATLDGKSVPCTLQYGGGYWVTQGYWVDGYWDTDGCNTWWVDPYYVDTSYYVSTDYTKAIPRIQASGLLNGAHTVSFVFTNQTGAAKEKAWTFYVNAPADTTPPVTTSNAVQYYTATATISLTATDGVGNTDVVATYYRLDGGAQVAGTPPLTNLNVATVGNHSLEFWSVDGAGNAETHKTVLFCVDPIAPLTIAGAQSSYAGTATVYLAPTDNVGGSGVQNTYYKVDSGAWTAPTLGSSTIAQYHFDEGSGSTLNDASGNALSGSLVVGASGSQTTTSQVWTNGAAGRFSSAMSFDGTDDYVNIGSKTALNNMGDTYSVGAWVKTSVNSGAHIIAGRSNDWYLIKSGSSYQFAMWTTTASYYVSATNTSTDWVYVVGTYDTTLGQMRLYLNGSLAATAAVSGPSRHGYTQTQIGNGYIWHTGGSYYNDDYWNGLIDEVTFSNVARSAEDIKSYYQAATTANVAPLQLSVLAPTSGAPVSHTVSYYSTDKAGNVEPTKTVSFSVSIPPDLTPPTTSSNAVASYIRPGTITLTATDNAGGWGVASTYYKLDNNATQTGVAMGTGLNGNHTLQFWSVDAAGNVEVPKVATYTVQADVTPPVTTANALSYYIGPAAITLTATDTGWGVANTYYQLDSGAVTAGTTVTVAPPVAGTVTHKLYFWSTDNAGNIEATKTATFDVLALPYPMSFSGITPAENSVIGVTNPTVSITANADQTISTATGMLDGSPVVISFAHGGGYWVSQGYWVDGYWDTDGCNTWWVDAYYVDTSYYVPSDNTAGTVSFPTSGLASGPHTVAVTFTVASGAQNTKTWTFVVDTVPPTTTSDAKASYTGTATVSLTATDNLGGSGVKNTYFQVDGGVQTSGTAIVVAPPVSGQASHTIAFWSVDNLGNTETPKKTATFVQNANPDTTAPVTTSNATTTYPLPSTITLTATDNAGGWGVRDTYYKLDTNGAITTGTAPVTAVPTGGGGPHTLYFWSVDRAGNKESTKSVSYTVTPDTTPPSVSSNAQSSYTGTATISITATDPAPGWGVKAIYYQLDGGAVATITAPTASVSVPSPFIGSAGHTLVFWASDMADNVCSPVTANFTINAAPANVVFSAFAPPKSGTTQSVNPTISVYGVADQPITGVTATLDGVAKVPLVSFATTSTGSAGHYETATAVIPGTFTGVQQFDGYMSWGPDYFDESDYAEKWTCYASFNLAPYAGYTITGGTVSWTFDSTPYGNGDDGQQKWITDGNGTQLGQWGLWDFPNSVAVGGSYLTSRAGSTATINYDSDNGDWYDDVWSLERGMANPTLTITYQRWVAGNQTTGTDATKATAAIPTVGLSQGAHTVSFSYTVTNGSIATTSWAFIVDSIAPTTSSNVATGYTGTANIALTAQDNAGGSGVKATYYKVDGGAQTTGTAITITAPVSGSTTHTVSYWSVDNAGNVEASHNATFTQSALSDTTPPSSGGSQGGTYYGGGSVTTTITATDSGWGVDHICYRLDNGPIQTVYGSVAAITVTTEGWHTLEWWAVDKAGNEEVPHHFWTFCIDRTPPVTTATVLPTYSASAVISLNATDGVNSSGVKATYYKVDGGTQATGNTISVAGPASGVATHTITFWSVDNASNTETAKTATFTISALPAAITWSNITPAELSTVLVRNPTVSITGKTTVNITGITATLDGVAKTPTITYPSITTTAQVWVTSGYNQDTGTGYWYDDGCETTWVENYVWVDTSHYETQTISTTDYTQGTASFSTSGLSDGVHTASFTYTVAGGAQATKTWTFTVYGPDNLPPNTTPIYQSAYVGTATVSLVATDNSSGVVATYYKVDGGSQISGTPPTTTITIAPPAYGAAVSHSIVFWSVDALGNTETQKTISFTVAPTPDTIAPTTTSSIVPTYTGAANISLTATDNVGGWGVASTYYKIDGGTQAAYTTTVTVPAPSYASAVHTMTYWSVDRAGNAEISKTQTFTINALADSTAPVTTSNALTVYAAPSTIALSATDAGWGVLATYYKVNSGATTTYTAAIGTGSQGSYTLQFWSVDRANNVEATKTVTYVVDQTAPVTTTNALTSYTASATVALAATDNHPGSSGVRYTYYKVDNGSVYTGSSVYIAGPSSGPPVSHTITYWSVDYAGNAETQKTVTFNVTAPTDNVAPTTTSNAAPFYALPGTIVLTASDNVGGWGIAHTYYILDGGVRAEGTSIGTGGSGAHTLQFWSVDNANNVEATKTVSYNVDMTPPTTTSDAKSSYTGTATVSLTATDNALGSGVRYTFYKVDSGTQTTGTTIVVGPPVSNSQVHTVYFWSVDNMGNTETQKTATFTVNALPDTAAPSSSANVVATYARPATITINATDVVGGWGLSAINYSIDGSATVAGYNAAIGGIMTASCQVGTGGGGTHTIEYWAVDKAGNAESPHHTFTYTVTPDTTAPITTSNAVPLYIGPAAISLVATDPGGWGVARTLFTVDGGAQTSGTVISVSAPIAGQVQHSITFWSVDLAGNVESAHTATFTVAGIPANMTFSNILPVDGSTLTTGWATIQVRAVADQNITAGSMTLDGVAKTPTVAISSTTATATFAATGLTNGAHTVAVTFTNASGQQATKTWSFTVALQTDFTPPTTTSNAVASYLGQAQITLNATDNAGGTGVKATYFKLDSGAQQQGTLVTVAGPASGDPVSHTLYFWSVDYAGNIEATKSATFQIAPPDTTAPHSTSNAQPYYNAPSTIQLAATDNQYGAGVTHIYYRLDGGSTVEGTLLGTGGVGTHVLEFWAVDGAGNVETPHNVVTYKVDVTAPVTTSNAQTNYVGTAYVTLTSTDEAGGSGIKGTYYIIDNGTQIQGTTATIVPPTSGSQQHTLYFWAQDNAGNIETTKSATFTVAAPPDTTAPTTSSDARASYAVPGLIALTAVDNSGGWGVDHTYWKLDGGAQTEGTQVRTGGVGSHTLEFWSVDKATNAESPHKTVSYNVVAADTQAPVTSTDATSSYIGVAKITLTATDNCGVPPVTYYQLDGGTAATGTVVTVVPPRSGGANHTLYYRSVDINGNSEATKSVTFAVNAQQANMAFSGISPADGAALTVRNPIVTITATSPSNNIVDAVIEVDGVAKPANVSFNGQWATITYQASGLTNGGHTVTATFIDAVSASSVKSWTFNVNATTDSTAPGTTSDGQAYYAGTAQIHLFATDDAGGMGVAGTSYKLDGGSTLSGTPPTSTITVAAAGTHVIEYWSTDLAGNVELPHKTITFVVDLLPPTTASNAGNAYTGTAVITLSPTDNTGGSGVANTYYIVDSGTRQTGTTVQVAPPASGSQLHKVYYWSVDNAGNIESTKTATFNVWAPTDVTAPVTTSDVQSAYTMPSIIHLSATDAGGWGVAHVYYVLDGGLQTEGTFLGTGGAGTHTLEYWAIDAAGNVESPHHTITYTVAQNDTTAPTTTSDAAANYTAPAVIHLTATDGTGSGVAHTYYRIDGGAQSEGTMFGVAGGGSHTIQFWSVDWVGNIEATNTASFTITLPDTSGPVTTTNALASYTGTATIVLTPSDPSGVRATYYRLDGGAVQTGTSVVVAPPVAGTVSHSIEYWSVDTLGNTEGSKVVTFNVSAVPDTVAPTTTSDGVASYTGTATIALTPTDNTGGSGVKATYYRIDSGAQQQGTTIVVAPPTSGAASHVITFWSVDSQNNTETAKTLSIVVNAPVVNTTATLTFNWIPTGYGTATLHVQDASGKIIANTSLSGWGTDLCWTVTVPAGQNYYMECDSYYDDDDESGGGGYGVWSGVVTNGQNFVWSY